MISLEDQCYWSIVHYILRQETDIPYELIKRYVTENICNYPAICDRVLDLITNVTPKSLSSGVLRNLVHEYTTTIKLNHDQSPIDLNAVVESLKRCRHYLRELGLSHWKTPIQPLIRNISRLDIKLRHLNLDNCSTLRDIDTSLIITHLRQSLEVFSALNCPELTDKVFDIRSTAPQMTHFPCALTQLGLSSPKLSDAVISNLVFIGRQLLVLNVAVCLRHVEPFLLLAGFPADPEMCRNIDQYFIGLRSDGPVLRRSRAISHDRVRLLNPTFRTPNDEEVPSESNSPSTNACVRSGSCIETLVEEVAPLFRPAYRRLELDFHGLRVDIADPKLRQLLFRLLLLSCRDLEEFEWSDQQICSEVYPRRVIEPDTVVPLLHCFAQEKPSLKSLTLQWREGFLPICLYPLVLLSELRSLSLFGAFVGDDAVMVAIIGNNPRLTHLRLPSSDIGDAAAKALADSVAPELETLDISWCDDTLSYQGVTLLSKSCRNLRHLNLRMGFATRQSIQRFVRQNKMLEYLQLHGIQRPRTDDDEDVEESEDEEMEAHEQSIDGEFEELGDDFQNEIINDDVCQSIARNLMNLVELDISFNIDITDVGVHAILASCLSLEILNLADCKRITTAPFTRIVPDFPRYEKCQKALQVTRVLRLMRGRGEDVGSSSDEVDEFLYFPSRSKVFAPRLSFVDVTGCDFVREKIMESVMLVCRESLQVIHYYGDAL